MTYETTIDGYTIEYYCDIDKACYIDSVKVKDFDITDVVSDGVLKHWEGVLEYRLSYNDEGIEYEM